VTNRFSVLFRCDASPSIGLGHLVRCLALADELHENHGVAVTFGLRASPLASEMVKRRSYPILEAPEGGVFDQEAWLLECILKSGAEILVVDVRDDLSKTALEGLAEKGTIIAVLDDLSDRRWAADLAFYPPVPQVHRVDWSGFRGRLCVGWEWIVLRSQFAERFPPRDNSKCSLLVAMGGSDPAGLTLKAVRALDRLDEDFESVIFESTSFESTIIVGAGFCHRESLQDLLGQTRRHFTVREDVSEMSAAMAQADLAVCSFGMTSYELAAMGVPAVCVCLTEDHAESASALVGAGMGISVGVNDQDTETLLAAAVERLLVDKNARAQMSARARELVDGRGARRIAELLVGTAAGRTGTARWSS
jgi:spore coat polysaccharide biosynthesis predicted glycosyltransferase SpsG